jgi:signal transduction histidine kinase
LEITRPITFSKEEIHSMSMHSVINIMTAVQMQMIEFVEVLGLEENVGQDCISFVSSNAHELLQLPQDANLYNKVIKIIKSTEEKIDDILNHNRNYDEKKVELIRQNFRSIFDVLRFRTRELIKAANKEIIWTVYNIKDLYLEFNIFFRALEKNAKNKYRIVRNIAESEDTDYLLNLEFSSLNEETIASPFVFRDIIRDLVSNARKYTPPGGFITAGLYESDKIIRFVIKDSGCGIPPDEIDKVIDFGYRAENTQNRVTYGGGFGLSKAYYYVKKLNGRLWIESPTQGASTLIKIEIPKPKALSS